jgi:hypothetical protein
MANELAAQLQARDLVAGSGGNPGLVDIGFLKALSFGPKGKSSAYGTFRVPNVAALATGLTAALSLMDDTLNTAAGKATKFGVTIGPLTSGTSTPDDNATTGAFVSTTEATATSTLTTTGLAYTLSVAVPVATMNALAAGGVAMIRIRRLGDDVADTHTGRVLLFGVDVRNT